LDPAGAGELSKIRSGGFGFGGEAAGDRGQWVRPARLRAGVPRMPVRASSPVGVVWWLAARDHEGMRFQPPYWRTTGFFAAWRRGRVMDVFPGLTRRGHRVFGLVAAGRGGAGIGGEFVLSVKTVRDHGSNTFTELQVSGRVRGMVCASGAGPGG
jgi:hypothetical protein